MLAMTSISGRLRKRRIFDLPVFLFIYI